MQTEENTFKKSSKQNLAAQHEAPPVDLNDDFDFERFLERDTSNPLAFPGEIPGYRLYWAAKNVQGDIANKSQIGYELVRPEEFPNFPRSESGGDMISVKEMVLMKIPEARWQALMNFFYRKLPDQAVAGMKSEVFAQRRVEAAMVGINQRDGFGSMGITSKPARF